VIRNSRDHFGPCEGLNWVEMRNLFRWVRRSLLPLVVLIGALAVVLTTSASTHPESADVPADKVDGPSAQDGYDYARRWQEVDHLRDEDKYAAAAEIVDEILIRAVANENQDEWTRALVRSVQLRTALHGYETAVRILQEQPWPEAPVYRAVLELFYAHGLVTYLRSYAWEIAQRELVETEGEVDLKRWTRDQIFNEAQRAYRQVWKTRGEWGDQGLGELSEYLAQNNYPARIRGSLRDAVTYLWVELLADSSLWRPGHSNQVYRLDREVLLERGKAGGLAPQLGDSDLHPLLKIAAVLDDLEAWHLASERSEAALEARLQRLRHFHAALDKEVDRAVIRAHVEAANEELGRRYEWWSMGQAVLAELVQQEAAPDALIRARDIALAGESAHPDSLGGQRCRHIVAAIGAPAYDLTAMRSDGPERRSILIRHKNLDVLHFRAYRLDLIEQIESSKDYNLLPGYREVPEIMDRQLPVAEWSAALPETRDYQMHQTFGIPQISTPGLYLVVASARRNFLQHNNRIAAVNLVIGDLVLLTRNTAEGFQVEVRSGESGRPLPAVDVTLYRYDYRRGHRPVASRKTNDAGEVTLSGPGRQQDRYFLVARQGDQIGLDPTALWRLRQSQEHARHSALVYTDRSVYRPQQRIQWKVVAYRMGGEEAPGTMPSQALRVELVDANYQVVDSRQVKANSFGAAAGEFEIPAGRLLGQWHLRTSLGGDTAIRVEEYKRPTFEVAVQEPQSPLRLNRQAELRGDARYYFGLPVVEGEVAWRVERMPVYPRWWWYWRPVSSQPEIIASGETTTDAEGVFQVRFLPAADEREGQTAGVSYRFRLQVEVIDDGGETRSAQRDFRLGFVAVQASIEADRSFFLAGQPVAVQIRRTDLDGTPTAGMGEWELYRLQQPEETLLPAEQPLPRPPNDDGHFSIPGDDLRTRWDPGYNPEQVMGLWQAGKRLAGNDTLHNGDGLADVDLGSLANGAYRLTYRTVDDFDATFETTRELVVASPGRTPVALPALFLAEQSSVAVGETARLLIQSGLGDQEMVLEVFRGGKRASRRILSSDEGVQVIEIPIRSEDRGGFGVRLTALRDHQLMTFNRSIFVPWEDRDLQIRFASFRDLLRPGTRETWQVEVKGWQGDLLERGAAEVLAYMYDRSLDVFAPHRPPEILSLYPNRTGIGPLQGSLGGSGEIWSHVSGFDSLPGYPHLMGDRLIFFDGYGIGGPGMRHRLAKMGAVDSLAPMRSDMAVEEAVSREGKEVPEAEAGAEPAAPLRSDFSETAFWKPHLLLGDDGTMTFEFTVPDSVTEWNIWVHAVTRDLRGGSLRASSRSAKDLMVRPYLPRFLREGDRAELRVVVNNASQEPLSGELEFDIRDPGSGESLLAEFRLEAEDARSVPFSIESGGSSSLVFPLVAPARVGEVAIEVRAQAGDWSDGERRLLPLLPGRMHLSQSRFAALRHADRRELHFADMAADDDPTRLQEQLVVTLDAQLFYGVLQALPYLTSYPYECTEQTLNRFVSTGIVTSLYDSYPAVARMAKEFSQRQTQFETWDGTDANRKMALEETPWLRMAQGGDASEDDLLNVLDPRIARAERRAALGKLAKAQTSLGGFPWWAGGPPSPYMTLYLLHGFSRALEFDIEIPQQMVVRAWQYMHSHYVDELVQLMMAKDCCWEMVTFLNYVLSSYPDDSWTGGLFTLQEKEQMLDFSFRHWRRHSPLLKSYLALTLQRAGRQEDASLVFQSVMDSSKTTRDEGTFWAPEDRAWLWYNDTIETHAFALRTLGEIDPADERRHGLVQWLFLNKKLNHWKSTRATAEVIYSLVHYLDREGGLGQREAATVRVGDREETFSFEPDRYTGGGNQIVIAGDQIDPVTSSTVVVEKNTPGLMFASATWHFSTAELPAEGRGDFFSVERSFYRRLSTGDGWVLRPLTDGEPLAVGDQIEVQLSLRARHAAEFVHLRDPRGAGFEPVSVASSYKWNLGIGWYEEIRDSGTNFFFDWLPVGEYTFKYRLRVAMAGRFKVAPAVIQSMYAPEFTAYSAGAELSIGN